MAAHRQPRSRLSRMRRFDLPFFVPFPLTNRKNSCLSRNAIDRSQNHDTASLHKRRHSQDKEFSHSGPSSHKVRTISQRRLDEPLMPKLGFKKGMKVTMCNDGEYMEHNDALRVALSAGSLNDGYNQRCHSKNRERKRKGRGKRKGKEEHIKALHQQKGLGSIGNKKRKLDSKDTVFYRNEANLHVREASLRRSLCLTRRQRLMHPVSYKIPFCKHIIQV